jgi:hypothetical protein
MSPEVFIAYAREDARAAEAVVGYLQGTGLHCWYDVDLVPGTPEWEAEIERAISVVLISPPSVISKHVKAEFSLARDRDKAIIPFFLAEEVELPNGWGLRLALHQYLSASPSLEAALPRLAEAVWRVVDHHRHPQAYQNEEEVRKRANFHLEPRFTDNPAGLFLGENDHSVTVIEDGAFVMTSKPGASPGYRLDMPLLTDFVLEARLRKIHGPDDEGHWFGFFFGEPYPEQLYEFLINGQKTVKITKHVNRRWQELARHQEVRPLNAGSAQNLLKIIRKGDACHIMVNGLQVLSVIDGDIRAGRLGLVMGPDLRVAYQDLRLAGSDLNKLFQAALWHLGKLDARMGRQLLRKVVAGDPSHAQAVHLLGEFRPDYRDSILITIGHKVLPQLNDGAAAAKLRQEINRRGGEHELRVAGIVTDTALGGEERYLKCPVITIGGPRINAITAALAKELPHDAVSTETRHIQHEIDHGDRRVALWGDGAAETAQAVELFIASGLLDRFLKLIWRK